MRLTTAVGELKKLLHGMALENTSGLSCPAQQDFGAKTLANNQHSLTVLEVEHL